MKSGKISHCEQTDSNKKKENIMCFSSQRMVTKKAQICNQKEKRVNAISLERKYKEVSKVAIWWPQCYHYFAYGWMDRGTKMFNLKFLTEKWRYNLSIFTPNCSRW